METVSAMAAAEFKVRGTGALPASLDKVHVKYGTRETTLRSTKIEYSMNPAICINSAFPTARPDPRNIEFAK